MWVTRFARMLMGVPYSYADVKIDPPPATNRVVLEQPRPDLDRHERLIAEHRRRDLGSYAKILPRSAIEPLLRADGLNTSSVSETQRRREAAEKSERMDAPVLLNRGQVRSLGIADLAATEAEPRRQIWREECSIVPVMRRRTA
jgi:hypothetical protein